MNCNIEITRKKLEEICVQEILAIGRAVERPLIIQSNGMTKEATGEWLKGLP